MNEERDALGGRSRAVQEAAAEIQIGDIRRGAAHEAKRGATQRARAAATASQAQLPGAIVTLKGPPCPVTIFLDIQIPSHRQ